MLALLQQYRLLLLGLATAALMTLSAAGAWQWQANAYGKQLAEQASTHAHTLGEIARAAASKCWQLALDDSEDCVANDAV